LPGHPYYDGKAAAAEPNGVKHSSITNPLANGTLQYPIPQGNLANGVHGWDSSSIEDDFARRFLGLGLVDQQNAHHHLVAVTGVPSQNGAHSFNVQPSGNHYNSFSPDYSPYFSNAPALDQYFDYQHGYDSFRPPFESSIYVGSIAT
jgi:hypothetical protein